MSRLILSIISLSFITLLSSCVSKNGIEARGVTKWLAEGATISDEPEPRAPDAAMPVYEDEGGPVEFSISTDSGRYPTPKPKKTKPERDPLDPYRDSRIRRLVR